MELFNIEDKVIVITGGAGILGSNMATYLLKEKANVVILGHSQDKVDIVVKKLKEVSKNVSGYICDVLDEEKLQQVVNSIVADHGSIDVLINAAGGNMPGATIGVNQTIFDVDINQFKKVVDLNLFGTIIPSLLFGKVMTKQKKGSIINISSMTAQSAITRVVGYSASKAAIDNYTKWLSVEFALKFGEGLRVNAIAPGFFIGNQNRDLLIDKETGAYTERGETIINNTPMKRFGDADELNGAIHYLCADASKFVTGTVMPIDGGFSVFSGV